MFDTVMIISGDCFELSTILPLSVPVHTVILPLSLLTSTADTYLARNTQRLSSVLAFFVSPTEIQKADSCVGLKRTGYHVMRESVNGDSETALILASLTADNYRAEQLLAP